MSKSQNKKNEQQNNLCITSEQLTEQWRKGELPSGWYYVQLQEGVYADNVKSIIMDYYTEFCDFMKHPYLIEQILAPVPSYDEYMTMKDCAKKEFEAVEKYTKVKELLKECRNSLEEQSNVRKLYESDVEYRDRYNKKMDLLIKLDEVLK